MTAATPSIRTIADVEQFEQIPLERRISRWTIPAIVAGGAEHDPDAVALYFLQDADPQETPDAVSYAQLLARSTQAANMLWRLWGDKTGVAAVLLPLVPENYYLLCGGTAAGILCPINPALHPSKIAGIIASAGAEVLITLGPTPGFDIWETALEVLKQSPGIRKVVQVRGPGGQVEAGLEFSELANREAADKLAFDRPLSPADTAIYCPTGGTTGAPKLAMLSHRSIAYKCHAFRWVLGHGPGDVIPAGLPLFHVGGIVSRTLSPLSSGMTNVVVSPHGFRAQSSRKNYWKLVERYGITELVAPPTMLAALLSVPVDGCDLSSLKKYANTGSTGLPVAVARAFEDRGIRLLGNYGLTEYTASAALSTRSDEHPLGSSGIRLPYTDMKVVVADAQGKESRDAEPDEAGIVAIRGPGAIRGYVDPAYDKSLFFSGGWINTGDIGRIDTAGRVWITGRLKDLIIRGGHNIDASVIENTLLGYPGVEFAAAVGKPDAYAGELPVAYVQARPGVVLDAQAIREFARGAIPERGAAPVDIFLTERMPMTEVGKIFKLPLRAQVTRQVFEDDLGFVAQAGADLRIDMDFASASGLRAEIRVALPAGGEQQEQALVDRIHAALDRYTLPYSVHVESKKQNNGVVA